MNSMQNFLNFFFQSFFGGVLYFWLNGFILLDVYFELIVLIFPLYIMYLINWCSFYGNVYQYILKEKINIEPE